MVVDEIPIVSLPESAVEPATAQDVDVENRRSVDGGVTPTAASGMSPTPSAKLAPPAMLGDIDATHGGGQVGGDGGAGEGEKEKAAAVAVIEEQHKTSVQQATTSTMATSRFKMTIGMFSAAGSRTPSNVSSKSPVPAASGGSSVTGANGSGSGSGPAVTASSGGNKFSSYAGRARSFLGEFCHLNCVIRYVGGAEIEFTVAICRRLFFVWEQEHPATQLLPIRLCLPADTARLAVSLCADVAPFFAFNEVTDLHNDFLAYTNCSSTSLSVSFLHRCKPLRLRGLGALPKAGRPASPTAVAFNRQYPSKQQRAGGPCGRAARPPHLPCLSTLLH